jgi:hypothetical protein
VYEEIPSALHFDRERVFPPKLAAILPPDTFDARDGDTITYVSAEGKRPGPESDAFRVNGKVTAVDDKSTTSVCRGH